MNENTDLILRTMSARRSARPRPTSAPPRGDGELPLIYSNRLMGRNPMMFLMPNPSVVGSSFTRCAEPGCMVSSGVAEFPSMTLRTGLPHCSSHVKMNEVMSRLPNPSECAKKTVIFYDIELSRDGEIEQMGASTISGKRFSAFIRTPVRTSTSPILRSIAPEIWNMFAERPEVAITRFIRWAKEVHSQERDGDTDEGNIMLAAHYGSCHDHMHLIRTMMRNGIHPPGCALVDTLAIFKVFKGMDTNAKLVRLRDTYAPWMPHTPHDADSDAEVLRYVTMIAFKETVAYCQMFAITQRDFIRRVGLNLFVPSPIVTFDRTDEPTQSNTTARSSTTTETDGDES